MRNPKSEINPNDRNPNAQNGAPEAQWFEHWRLVLNIRALNLFRISCFGFRSFFERALSLTKTDAKKSARQVDGTDGPQVRRRLSRRREGDEERHRARPPDGRARGRRRVGSGRGDGRAARGGRGRREKARGPDRGDRGPPREEASPVPRRGRAAGGDPGRAARRDRPVLRRARAPLPRSRLPSRPEPRDARLAALPRR